MATFTITCSSGPTKANLGSYPQSAKATITINTIYHKDTNSSSINISSFSATNTSDHFTGSTRDKAGYVQIAIGKDSTGAGDDSYYNIGTVRLPRRSTNAKGSTISVTPWTRKHDTNGKLSVTIWARIVTGTGNYDGDTYVYNTGSTKTGTLTDNQTVSVPPEAPTLSFQLTTEGFDDCFKIVGDTYEICDGSTLDITMYPGAAGKNVEFATQYAEYQPKPELIHRFRERGEPRATEPITFKGWKPKSSHNGSASYVVRAVEAYKRNGTEDYAVRDYKFKILPKPIFSIVKNPVLNPRPNSTTTIEYNKELILDWSAATVKNGVYQNSIIRCSIPGVVLTEIYQSTQLSGYYSVRMNELFPELWTNNGTCKLMLTSNYVDIDGMAHSATTTLTLTMLPFEPLSVKKIHIGLPDGAQAKHIWVKVPDDYVGPSSIKVRTD